MVHQQCLACGHAWVHYQGQRQSCLKCSASKFSRPSSLSDIREAMQQADRQAAAREVSSVALQARKSALAEDYFKAAPVFARRADEVFGKVSTRYLEGDLSDYSLDALVFAFHLFTELGLHEAAVRCGLLIAAGHFRRAQEKEIQDLKDLADLAAARQWFRHLRQDEWVGTVDTLIGLKAGHTVVPRVRDKYLLLQISDVHLNRARQYYARQNQPLIQQRLKEEIEAVTQQLSHTIGAVGTIEGDEISAQSRLDASRIVAGGLTAGFATLAIHVSAGLDALGQRIDVAGGRVANAITAGAQYVGDKTLAGAFTIGTSVMEHAKTTREAMRDLGKEVGKSVDSVGNNTAKAISGMGMVTAAGLLGAGVLHATILDGTLKQFASEASTTVKEGLARLSLLQPLNRQPAPPDLKHQLIAGGLDVVNRRLQDYDLTVNQTGGGV